MYFHEMPLNISRDDEESPDGRLSLSVSKCGREIWLRGGLRFFVLGTFSYLSFMGDSPLKVTHPHKNQIFEAGRTKILSNTQGELIHQLPPTLINGISETQSVDLKQHIDTLKSTSPALC